MMILDYFFYGDYLFILLFTPLDVSFIYIAHIIPLIMFVTQSYVYGSKAILTYSAGKTTIRPIPTIRLC